MTITFILLVTHPDTSSALWKPDWTKSILRLWGVYSVEAADMNKATKICCFMSPDAGAPTPPAKRQKKIDSSVASPMLEYLQE